MNSIAFRIALYFSGLLALVLFLDFTLVSVVNQRIARDVTATELATGEKVFKQLMSQHAEQLTQAARVLAADSAFREAVTLEQLDRDTIASALSNHGGRINADLVMLSDLDGKVLVDTLQPEREGKPYPFGDWSTLAQGDYSDNNTSHAAVIEQVNGKLYQIVRVPVRAPLPVAWVSMGFAIDDRVADSLRQLSNLQVTFFVHQARPKPAGSWQLLASTFDQKERKSLVPMLAYLHDGGGQLMLNEERYESRLISLGDKSLYVLLSRSLREITAPFNTLQWTLAALAVFALILSLLAAIHIARRIANPLRALAIVAERIQQGDYQQNISQQNISQQNISQRSISEHKAIQHTGSLYDNSLSHTNQHLVYSESQDEIAQLASGLAHMQTAIAEREARISRLAYEDSLTGLPNRLRFHELLDATIHQHAIAGQLPLTIVLINLDRFQQINNALGHPFGDQVLVEVSHRLSKSVHQFDQNKNAGHQRNNLVARLSGDIFAVLLDGVHVDNVLIKQLLSTVNQRVELDGRPLDLRTTVGIAAYPTHGINAIELLRNADQALYRAKHAGLAQLVFDPSQQVFSEAHLSLLGDLQKAVENDELVLYYQPKVSLATGQAGEAESLVRWIHPVRGFIPPNDFIPFAEQTGYITEVTRWVLRHAVWQAAAWAQAGRPIRLSVNLSTRDLLDTTLPAHVAALLQEYQLPASLLCLEITESGLMEEPAKALDVLQRLRQLDLALSIDDYGTGYSSLAYMRRLPVTELKIDRAFVLELAQNDRDALIVRSTIELGHGLGLKVVAEGVEDQATVTRLTELGCDSIQGYVFARPMKHDDFIRWHETRDAQDNQI